jgi:putative addiction module CopG family antidote
MLSAIDKKWVKIFDETVRQALTVQDWKKMSIFLKPEHERFIQSQIESGAYDRPDEVIDAAFRLLKERENRLGELHQPIATGQEIDGEAVFTSLGSSLSKQSPKKYLELEFYRLAENWKHETASFSSISKKINHQDYVKIVAMGNDVLPLILRSLLQEPDHWFVALKNISKEDPIPAGTTFSDSVSGWLKWGQEKGLI